MRQGGTGPYRKGHWSVEEDIRLIQFVRKYGEGRWSKLAKTAGLQRCGKSCRLRWVNYLRPDIKRGHISEEEERLIIKLHSVFGNKWSLIAIHLPGRSDNEIKNYWRSHIKKKLKLEDLSTNTDTHSSHIDSALSGTSQNGEGCNIAMMDSTSYNMLGFEGSTNPPVLFGHTHDDDEDGYELHNSINSFGTNEVILPSYKNNMPSYANLTQETSQFQLTKEDTSRLFKGDTMFVHDESPNNSYNQYLGNSSQGHFDALEKIDDPPCSGGDGSWEFYASRQATQETWNIPTNKQQALALHYSDVPWDVETIQPIVEVQNSPYAAHDNTYGCELWDSADLFPEAYPNFQE